MMRLLRYELRKLLLSRYFLLTLVLMSLASLFVVSQNAGLTNDEHDVIVLRGSNDTYTWAMQEVRARYEDLFAMYILDEDAYVFDEAALPLLVEGGAIATKYGFSVDPDTVERAAYAGGYLYPEGTENVLEVWLLPRVLHSDASAFAIIAGLTLAGVIIGREFRNGTFYLPILAGISKNQIVAVKIISYLIACAIAAVVMHIVVFAVYIPDAFKLMSIGRFAAQIVMCTGLMLVPALCAFIFRDAKFSVIVGLLFIILFTSNRSIGGINVLEPIAAVMRSMTVETSTLIPALAMIAGLLVLTIAAALWATRRDAVR